MEETEEGRGANSRPRGRGKGAKGGQGKEGGKERTAIHFENMGEIDHANVDAHLNRTQEDHSPAHSRIIHRTQENHSPTLPISTTPRSPQPWHLSPPPPWQ